MEQKTNMKLGTRLIVLLALMGMGLIVASILFLLVDSTNLLMMLSLQDILAFILPAVAAMAIFYRRPLHVMCLDRAPGWKALFVVVLFYIVSVPAMNWLVDINQAMSLPSWLSGLEKALRAMEDSAADTTLELLEINSLMKLVSTVFVVGLMAGLSEEILFRGAMQRTMQDSRLGTHAAVWITAFIFSAIHLQFFGFLPRFVLGLWLGYLLVWTRSLWVPIIAHTLNNSTVALFGYLSTKGIVAEDFGDNIGLPSPGSFPWILILSVIFSIAIAIWSSRHLLPK